MDGVLEITTRVGCKINCKYCPQELLIQNYSKKQRPTEMSFESFKICIDKVPQEVMIDFAGMAEPWLNPNCTKMVQYAAEKGHKISIFSTLVGMTEDDLILLAQIPLEQFVIHIPDSENHSHIDITKEYIDLLKRVQTLENVAMMHYSCHGEIHDNVLPYIKKEFILANEMIDRAGNLQDEGLTHQECIGKKVCLLTGKKLNSNVLLPDGTVLLCCMDYGMQHILGNLLTENYYDLFSNQEINLIRHGLDSVDKNILCNHCSNAMSFEDITKQYLQHKEENLSLWKSHRWLENQLVKYQKNEEKLKQYLEDILIGKNWLEEQNKNQLKEIQNQKKYIEELMQGKEWLEQQNKNQLEEIQNQKKYTEELIQGKQWLEQQNHLISQSEIQLKNEILDLEKQLAASENDIAKLRYKLNLLMEDRLIQKVIKIKKYQV